ncbi:hypothetical protein ATCC90586_006587 [Pythium insidiosum]|nr:hypothetical protein ATCC90586_006587 [Pythium insidiosum]
MPQVSRPSGGDASAPSTALDSTPRVVSLDFSNAYWGDERAQDVVAAVRRAASDAAAAVVQLDLRGNRFEAAGASVLAGMLRAHPVVVSLSLEWNNVGLLDTGVEALAAALAVDTRLVELDLRNNNIGPDGAKALAMALHRNQTLRRLDLRWNEIGNAGVLAFVEALQSNRSLGTLELTGNNYSLQHGEEVERLLARNRSIEKQAKGASGQQPEKTMDHAQQTTSELQHRQPSDPAMLSKPNDQLLLQLLAEKDALETDLNVARRHSIKLDERIEECEMQLQLLRKELESAKDDRDRYQQREIDARAESHDFKMRLEELENKRRIEFEEYRASRASLERECNVLRDKIKHVETLHHRQVDQKDQQIAELEAANFKLESENHRLTMSAGYHEELQNLKRELQDVARDRERAEQQLRATHSSELAAAQRHHDQIVNALESQLQFVQEQLEDSKRSMSALKERSEDQQASLLRMKVAHEKELGELKREWESDQQDRLQRSVAAIEAQVDEVKKGRLFLEKEVEKHLEMIMTLRNENLSLQQTHDNRLQALQEELDRQYKESQVVREQLASANKEAASAQEKVKSIQRRLEEQERNTARLRDAYEDRIKSLNESAATTARELETSLGEKTETITRLERDVARLERAMARCNTEHEQRFDRLAESMVLFAQEQLAKERERRRGPQDTPM